MVDPANDRGTTTSGSLRPTDAGVGDQVPTERELVVLVSPFEPRARLTPKGTAVVAVYRLKSLMAGLDDRDWLDVAGLVVDELDLVPVNRTSEADLDNLALCERCGGYDPSLPCCPYCADPPPPVGLSADGEAVWRRVTALLKNAAEERRG